MLGAETKNKTKGETNTEKDKSQLYAFETCSSNAKSRDRKMVLKQHWGLAKPRGSREAVGGGAFTLTFRASWSCDWRSAGRGSQQWEQCVQKQTGKSVAGGWDVQHGGCRG